jgi:DNA polymerase-3 subunit delta'
MGAQMSPDDPVAALPSAENQPHVRAVLGAALTPAGRPSHAYLFHGPSGAGKRTVARAFATALLAGEGSDAVAVAQRVARDAHPDLTWVRPSGAAEMLVADIEEPVVAAATRTPFEAARRVFVIEHADRMNDQAANRLLKTLEEPASFVHLILLAERTEDLLPTIVSRCLRVRFDPLPSEQIAQRLRDADVEPLQALACARLALGDARLARELAGDAGRELRAAGELFARSLLAGEATKRPWSRLLDTARAAGARAGETVGESLADELELVPAKERRRVQRESGEALKRAERRGRTAALDGGLRLAELWLRDVACVALDDGAHELVHAVDRMADLRSDAAGRRSGPLLAGVQMVGETRQRLALNVSEELALEALAYRLQSLLSEPG